MGSKLQHRLRPKAGYLVAIGLAIFAATLLAQLWIFGVPGAAGRTQRTLREDYHVAPLLISYGYYEKDAIQLANFQFFLEAGTRDTPSGSELHFAFAISSDACAPCSTILPHLGPFTNGPTDIGVKRVASSPKFTLLYRTENEGMDIASHNTTLEYLRRKGQLWRYRFFLMLNSSVRGPFFPAYMPPGWHWTHAYLVKFRGDVHAVGSSLVCLPSFDSGGPGPRLESWAYAVDVAGLEALLAEGALNVRRCKFCRDGEGIIVSGEYGIGAAMIKHGFNMATLMTRYAEDVDWRDKRHWNCNDNVHPSRHGTYDGIGFHPYETVFIKSSWHVADPYVQKYTNWTLEHLRGEAGTAGAFNYRLYRYGISFASQRTLHELETAYNVTGRIERWMESVEYNWF